MHRALGTENSVINPAFEDIPQIAAEMKSVEYELIRIIGESEDLIRQLLTDLFCSGKRLRPKLVLLSGLCFSHANEKMLYSAVAAELIHTASLIHDDIIDRAHYRRNKYTINFICGNHTAVLAGDFLFARAFEILSKKNLIKSMEYLVKAIQDMCTGEIIQANDLFNTNVSEKEYFDKINRKTASLISACCKAGAESGGAPETDVELLGLFGRYVGYAFQIMDDILDVTGDKKEMGKPVAHDIEEGNITLPFIYLLQEERYSIKYLDVLCDKNLIAGAKDEIIQELHKSGSLTKAYNMAVFFVNKAKEVIEPIPDSVYKDILLALSDEVIKRTH
jgi:heptaprenyl diphosphate synthase